MELINTFWWLWMTAVVLGFGYAFFIKHVSPRLLAETDTFGENIQVYYIQLFKMAVGLIVGAAAGILFLIAVFT